MSDEEGANDAYVCWCVFWFFSLQTVGRRGVSDAAVTWAEKEKEKVKEDTKEEEGEVARGWAER